MSRGTEARLQIRGVDIRLNLWHQDNTRPMRHCEDTLCRLHSCFEGRRGKIRGQISISPSGPVGRLSLSSNKAYRSI